MKLRQKLTDIELVAVSGGITIDNGEDRNVYKVKKNRDDSFSYSFRADDYNKFMEIYNQYTDPNKSISDNDDVIMEALLASGLLTPIG